MLAPAKDKVVCFYGWDSGRQLRSRLQMARTRIRRRRGLEGHQPHVLSRTR